MKNPWTKKNPFMRMWLSGANAAIGSACGRATAETKRQAEAKTRQVINRQQSMLGHDPIRGMIQFNGFIFAAMALAGKDLSSLCQPYFTFALLGQ